MSTMWYGIDTKIAMQIFHDTCDTYLTIHFDEGQDTSLIPKDIKKLSSIIVYLFSKIDDLEKQIRTNYRNEVIKKELV